MKLPDDPESLADFLAAEEIIVYILGFAILGVNTGQSPHPPAVTVHERLQRHP